MLKLIASFIILLILSFSAYASGNERIKTISDETQIIDGVYHPPPLSKLVSHHWCDAIRLRVSPSFKKIVIYEIFFNGLKRSVSDNKIRFVKTVQTDKSFEESISYKERLDKTHKVLFNKFFIEKGFDVEKPEEFFRDRKKIEAILIEAYEKCPPPKKIEIKIESLEIENPTLKKAIVDFELNAREYLGKYFYKVGLDGVFYTFEIYNYGYNFSFTLWSPNEGTKGKKSIDNFFNIVNKIESFLK